VKFLPAAGQSGPASEPGIGPSTFVRTLNTPSGLPWEQRRAAELDARMSAPAALAALQYRLVRVEPWSLGRAGRFAAVYLRGEALDRHVAEITVDGRPFTVVFASPASERAALIGQARRIALVAIPALLISAAIVSAFAVRADREARLEALEARAEQASRQAAQTIALKRDARILKGAGGDRLILTNALADIDWATDNRRPDAHLQALHWENGLMTLTVRGETPPLRGSGREIRKAQAPLGPGLWVWGIGPVAPSGGR